MIVSIYWNGACVDDEEATFKVTAATNEWIGIVFSPDLLMV